MAKSLVLVNSVYHLMTAVQLGHLAPPGETADLVVTDITPGLQDLVPRLRETGLFTRVIPAQAAELSARYPMNNPEAVAQCFSQGAALLRWAFGEEAPGEYAQVLFPNFDWPGCWPAGTAAPFTGWRTAFPAMSSTLPGQTGQR